MTVKAGIPQEPIFGPLFFLTYINGLLENIESTKLFADDTSLLSVVYNDNTSAEILNKNLLKYYYYIALTIGKYDQRRVL